MRAVITIKKGGVYGVVSDEPMEYIEVNLDKDDEEVLSGFDLYEASVKPREVNAYSKQVRA